MRRNRTFWQLSVPYPHPHPRIQTQIRRHLTKKTFPLKSQLIATRENHGASITATHAHGRAHGSKAPMAKIVFRDFSNFSRVERKVRMGNSNRPIQTK